MIQRLPLTLATLLLTATVFAVPAARAEEPPAPAPEELIVTPEIQRLMKELESTERREFPNDEVEDAANILGYHGANAAPAVPRLLELAQAARTQLDRNRAPWAFAALCRIDPQAALQVQPKLVDLLLSKEPIPYLIHPHREDAICLLCQSHPETAEYIVQSLIKTLADDKDADGKASIRRQRAVKILGKLGPLAKAAVPALRQATTDKCNLIPVASMESLVKVTGGDKETVELLEQYVLKLGTCSETYCIGAARCIMMLDCAEEPRKRLCARLVPAFKASDGRNSAIIRMLGILKCEEPGLDRMLVNVMLNSQYESCRSAAAEALGGIATVSDEAIVALGKVLASPNCDLNTRSFAARALAARGKGAASAKDIIKPVLGDKLPYLHLRAAEAYLYASEDAETAVATMVNTLKSDKLILSSLIDTLSRIAPETPEAVRALAELLVTQRDAGGRLSAILGPMGSAGREALPILKKARFRDHDHKLYATRAISLIEDAIQREELGGTPVPPTPKPTGTPGDPADDDF